MWTISTLRLPVTRQVDTTAVSIHHVHGMKSICSAFFYFGSSQAERNMKMQHSLPFRVEAQTPSSITTFETDIEQNEKRIYSKQYQRDTFYLDIQGHGGGGVEGGSRPRKCQSLQPARGSFTRILIQFSSVFLSAIDSTNFFLGENIVVVVIIPFLILFLSLNLFFPQRPFPC